MLSSTVQDRVQNREVLIAVIEQQTTTVWEPKTSYGLLGICELSYFVLTLRFHGLCMQYKIADQASYPSSHLFAVSPLLQQCHLFDEAQ
jgi:hypothetical protein